MLSKLKVNYSLVKSGMPKVVPAEFFTCVGISLKEVDFRSIESRIISYLHFAGHCLDLDGMGHPQSERSKPIEDEPEV